MNKLFKKIAGSIIGMAMAIGVGVVAGKSAVHEVEATTAGYTSIYKLDTTSCGNTSSNAYANIGTKTVENNDISIDWSLRGNGQQAPWRMGGKNLSGENREIYTQTALSQDVDRVEIGFGTAADVTVNSFTVTVHNSAENAADGSNAVATYTPTFAASSVIGVDFPNSYNGKFYRFVLNVTVSKKNNKNEWVNCYVQLSSIEFLKASSLTQLAKPNPIYNRTDNEITWPAVTNATSYQIKVDDGAFAAGSSPYSLSSLNLTSGMLHTVQIKAIGDGITYSDSDVASLKIAFLTHAGTESNPYTVEEARAVIDDNTGDLTLTEKCATGIVSEIVTAYSSEHGNITFNISSDGTTQAVQLQAYRVVGSSAYTIDSSDDVEVGDEVIISGTLKKYNSTYEFDAGSEVIYSSKIPAPAPTKTLKEIVIGGTYTTEFEYGAAFTFGGTVTAKYVEEGAQDKVLEASEYTITPAVGTQLTESGKVTISYTEGNETKTAEYNITVAEQQVPPTVEPTVALNVQSLSGKVGDEDVELTASIEHFSENPTLDYAWAAGNDKITVTKDSTHSEKATVHYVSEGESSVRLTVTNSATQPAESAQVEIQVTIAPASVTPTPTDEPIIIAANSLGLTSTKLAEEAEVDYLNVTYVVSADAGIQNPDYTGGDLLDTTGGVVFLKNPGYLYNKTALADNIAKFEVFINQNASSSLKIKVGFGSEALTAALTTADVNAGSSLGKVISSFTIPENSKFFRIDTSSGNAQIQVRITLGEASGGGSGEGGEGGEGSNEKGSQNNPYTVAEALAVAKALDPTGQTQNKVYTKGVITSTVKKSDQDGSYFFNIADKSGDEGLLVYWASCETQPEEGDEVLVNGYLKHYVKDNKSTYEILEGSFTITKSGGSGEGGEGGEGSNEKGSQNNPYTVAEALAVAKALNPAASTPSAVYTKGIITSKVTVSDQDGKFMFDIADEKGGEELLVYWASCDTQPEEGDEVLVNGKLKNFIKNEESTYEVINGSFTITKSGGEGGSGEGGEGGEGGGEEVTKATITFMANGGTGSMAAVQVDKGSQYTLPECKFTAPANKVFKGWKVNNSGSVKQPGEKITVSADTKLYAQWETRTLVNLTVTAPTKTDYFVGDKIDITGFKVVATYSNGDTEDVTNKIGSITIDTSKPGQKVITVTYDGMTQTFTINVTRNPDVHDGCHCSILAGSALISITTLMGAGLLMLRKRKEK